MKKENIYKFLYAACIMLIVGFVIRLGAYYNFNVTNSAPFYVFVIRRAVEFIIPSMLAFIVGKVMKKKYSK